MKKIAYLILTFSLFLGIFNIIFAQENQERIEINFFFSSTCPHCAQEKIFLENLEGKYPQLEIKKLGLFEKKNVELLKDFYQNYKVPSEIQGYVPITFIQERYFLGFSEEIGSKIENYILGLIKEEPLEPQPEEQVEPGTPTEEIVTPATSEEKITLPFFGEIDVSKIGLLTLSVLIGITDGFNACAMWALFFLLTFLVASGSRKRIFLIGGTFILVSGIAYFLFISVWLNLFLFIGYLKIIQTIISLLAIIFGLVCIKDYFAFGKGISFILPEKTRDKIVKKMEIITSPKLALPVALLGVAILAAGVNLIELLCTTGFPAVFTKILTAHHLPTLSHYFYLLIYILFYMLDDFIIFSVAILTLGAKPLPDRYKRISKLVSGFVLLILGLIMLIKPEILIFG